MIYIYPSASGIVKSMRKINSENVHSGENAPPTAFLLTQVGTQAAIRFAERISNLGLTPPQVGILFMLADNDGVNQRFLADRLGVVPSRLVVLLDELESAGLIERRATERRTTHAVHLTAKGKESLKVVGKASKEHNDSFLASLNELEKAQLRPLLQKIADQEGLTKGVHPGYKLMGRPKKEPTST